MGYSQTLMARRGLTRPERIDQLTAQLDELRAKHRTEQQQLRARRQRLESAERTKQRKLRTRRLILIGSYMEQVTGRDPEQKAELRRGLDRFLTRDIDRELFGLPPRPEPSNKTDTSQ